jgi:hypothetical protein
MLIIKKIISILLLVSVTLVNSGCNNTVEEVTISETTPVSNTVSVADIAETTMPKVIPEEYLDLTELPDIDGEFVIEKGTTYRISGVVMVTNGESLHINEGGELVIIDGGELIVEDGGNFTVGSADDLSYAKISIVEGGTLNVRNGGTVTLRSGRIHFKVEEKGTLKLSDANIENGEGSEEEIDFSDGSVLDISGDVSLPIGKSKGLLISERGEFRTNILVSSFEMDLTVTKTEQYLTPVEFNYELKNGNELVAYIDSKIFPGEQIKVAENSKPEYIIDEPFTIEYIDKGNYSFESLDELWTYRDISKKLESANSFNISVYFKGFGGTSFNDEFYDATVGRNSFSIQPYPDGNLFKEIYGELKLTTFGNQFFEIDDTTIFGEGGRIDITSLSEKNSDETPLIRWMIKDRVYEDTNITVYKNSLGVSDIEGFVDFLNTLEIGSTPTSLSVDFVTDDIPVTHILFYNGYEFSLTDNRDPDIGEIYIHPDMPVYVSVVVQIDGFDEGGELYPDKI